MSELDELMQRVNAAKAEMAQFDDDLRQEIQGKDLLISSLQTTIERHEAEALEAKSDIADLRSESRQLKEMLMTLLTAVESRRKENVNEALTQLDAEVTEIVAAENTDEPETAAAESMDEPDVQVSEEPSDEELLANLEFSDPDLPPHIDDMFEAEESSDELSADEPDEEPHVLSDDEVEVPEKSSEKPAFGPKWPWNVRKDEEIRPPSKPH